MNLPFPFIAIEDPESVAGFESELKRELKPGHPLFGIPVSVVAIHIGTDDFIFELLDESDRFAIVHLTFAGEREKPPWPSCELFGSFDELVVEVKKYYSEADGE